MQALEPPDSFHWNAAQGWLELGNLPEAREELEAISVASRNHPVVVELTWQIAVKDSRWAEALNIAERLCRLAPESPFGWIHRAYSLHELKRTQEAWDTLLPLINTFPGEWLIPYNLACYACKLGRIEEAKCWLNRAVEIGDSRQVTRLAAEDPDLLALHQRLT